MVTPSDSIGQDELQRQAQLVAVEAERLVDVAHDHGDMMDARRRLRAVNRTTVLYPRIRR